MAKFTLPNVIGNKVNGLNGFQLISHYSLTKQLLNQVISACFIANSKDNSVKIANTVKPLFTGNDTLTLLLRALEHMSTFCSKTQCLHPEEHLN